MKFEFHTENLTGVFPAADIDLMQQRFLTAAARANKLLSMEHTINVIFFVQPVLPWWGMGANAWDFEHLKIYMHPDHFYLRNNIHNGISRFSAVVAHELHHCARQRPGNPGYGKTLGEMMVSEGLAYSFQQETGHPDFADDPMTRGRELLALAEHTKTLLDVPVDENGKASDPRAEGIDRHAVGFAVVKGWRDYSGSTAAKAHAIPAQEILKPWLDGKYDIVPDRRPAWAPPRKFLRTLRPQG